MMTVWLDDSLQALQLKETLLEAGFAAQEILLTSPTPLGSPLSDLAIPMDQVGTRHSINSEVRYRLTVDTQTGLDEDLAKAVFRDCGITSEKIQARPLQGGFGVFSRKLAKEHTIRS